MKTGEILFPADFLLRPLACALMSLLAAPGCVVVPVRVPTETKTISGKPQQLDFTFLKAGATTRNEVIKNLAAIDTGVNENDFFWGRWEHSKWASALYGIPVGADRIWRMHNLLIQFDHEGMVKSWVVVEDKNLDQELDRFDPDIGNSPLDLSSPLHAKARGFYDTSDLVLTSDLFEYHSNVKADNFCQLHTPRTNLRMIAWKPGPVEPQPNLLELEATVYFAESAMFDCGKKKGHRIKRLALALDPPTFLLLRRYIKQTKHDASTTSPADGMNAPHTCLQSKPLHCSQT